MSGSQSEQLKKSTINIDSFLHLTSQFESIGKRAAVGGC